MENKQVAQPTFSRVMIKGIPYYRTRIKDADGKRVSLYARTEKELVVKLAMARGEIEDARFRKYNPTVAEYTEKWLVMQSAHIQPTTLEGYTYAARKYIIEPLGDMYMSEVTADDIKLAMVSVSKKSEAVYSTVNMLLKSIFYSAEYSNLIEDNPTKKLNAKGGTPKKEKEPLTDAQAKTLLDTIRGLPPYVFVMIGLYSGLRREEILALQWDCVFLDAPTPYISVRRAWHEESNRPVINTELKTKSARRDVPIPKVLVDCLREEKAKTTSDYVIADSEGQPLSYSQFVRIWNYIKVRSTGERTLYKYVNGQSIKKKVTLELGQKCRNKPSICLYHRFPGNTSPAAPHVYHEPDPRRSGSQNGPAPSRA